MIDLFVAGIPAPQGSKTRTKWGVREDNPNTRPWRAAVAAEAAAAMNGRALLSGPLWLNLVFTFPRPKSHYGAKGLKPSAPIYHTTRPDCDKLVRAVGDALTGICVRDDSCFADVCARKLYGSPAGARIIVGELT